MAIFPDPPTHYYGDMVRRLFVADALFLALCIPLASSSLPVFGIPIVVLVVLAGLTNPKSTAVLVMDALVAGIGLLVLEAFAVSSYSGGMYGLFVLLEAASILLLIALYYSVKSVRAMWKGTIGRREGIGEFIDSNSQ